MNEAIMKRLASLSARPQTVRCFETATRPDDFRPRLSDLRIEEAFYALTVELAEAVTGHETPTPGDLTIALRQPVAAVALLADLAVLLEVDLPAFIAPALDDLEAAQLAA